MNEHEPAVNKAPVLLTPSGKVGTSPLFVGCGRWQGLQGLGVTLWVLVLPGTEGGLASGPLPLGIAGDGSGFFLSVQSEC